MYFVKLDGQTFYDPRLEDYKIFNPKLKLEVNKAGGFDFTVYPSHPMFARIFKLKSIIEVYQDNTLLFRGRVLDDELAFDKAKKIICEGELAYFNDTILRPYEYTGGVRGYLELLVNQHNSQVPVAKQFTVGNVTVTDPNDYITRSDRTYPVVWDVLESKLINSLGGYVVVRRQNGINYLDYLEDSNKQSLQTIELGKNLLDLATKSSATELYTAILPLGKEINEDTGEKLTIKSVNGGLDYIKDDEAIGKYGFIMKSVEWPDVTIASNLLTKARQELAQLVKLSLSLTLTAIDLSMTDATIDEFRVFEYVNVNSSPHGINERLLVEKQELNLTNPTQDKLTIGVQRKSLTETQIQTDKAIENVVTIKGPKGDKGDPGERGNDGIAGKDGVGLTSTTINYALSTSGTVSPSSGWSVNVPSLVKGQYLWTRTKWTYTDDSTETGYSVTYISKDGNDGSDGIAGKDGVGIKSTAISYVGSTNGTTKPTTGWTSTIPSVPEGQYLWTRTTWTYTDNTTETGYSVAKMGVKGDKGDQGIQGPAGANGTSQYVHIRYSANADGSAMTTTPQANTQYIGLVTTTSATAPAANTSYTWSKFKGDPGAQGNQGIPGTPGANGQTTYTWVKYADTATGTGMSDSPDGKFYIGLAFNKTTQTESNTASDYTWSLMPQNIEIGARNLLLRSTETVGYWIDSAGKVASNNGTSVSDYIAITPLSDYMFTKTSSTISDPTVGGYFRFAWYTEDKTYIARMANSKNEFKWTAPSNAYYIRISYPDDSQVKFEKGNIATDWTPAPEDIEAELNDKASNEYVNEVSTMLNTTIEEVAGYIRSEVSETYTEKSEFTTYQEAVSTQFEQTSEIFNFTFNDLKTLVNQMGSDSQANFEEIRKFIRFEGGNIYLGSSDSDSELEITQDSINFKQSGMVVAYFNGQSFYINRGAVIQSMQIGEHKFVDTGNGHTIIQWVGG